MNYQPWSTSTSQVNFSYNEYGYGPSKNMIDQNLTGTSANYDWGVYNPISNGGNITHRWRTLTETEWAYLFYFRNTASGILYVKAQVNEVNGVILFPDDWDNSIYIFSGTNSAGTSFGSNTITAIQWMALENAGAVFLPAAGGRFGTSVNYIGTKGFYWSATHYRVDVAYNVTFVDNNLVVGDWYYRYGGRSVRLVQDCNP